MPEETNEPVSNEEATPETVGPTLTEKAPFTVFVGWKDDVTAEEMERAQEFIKEITKSVNDADSTEQIPEAIVSITISRE